MNELALFAGNGGGILGGKLLGWRTVCAIEINEYRCDRLAQRQNEGFLPPFPVWCGDITDFDGKPWRGLVDVVSGGFPCQDISAANPNAEGISGARSGLWKQMRRIICEVGSEYVLVENSPMLASRGLGVVLRDLSAMGYDAKWGVLGGDDIGAFHRRERMFIVANSSKIKRRIEQQQQEREGKRPRNQFSRRGETVAANGSRELQSEGMQQNERERTFNGSSDCFWLDREFIDCKDGKIRATKPGLCGMANGVADRVDRIEAIGDGQIPAVVAVAWKTLSQL